MLSVLDGQTLSNILYTFLYNRFPLVWWFPYRILTVPHTVTPTAMFEVTSYVKLTFRPKSFRLVPTTPLVVPVPIALTSVTW